METMWPIVLVGIQLVAATIGEKYDILKERLTWTSASNACMLAKPNITYEDKKEKVEIGALEVTQSTWVGYVVEYVVLNYVGCYQRKTISSPEVRKYTTRLKVDVCFSACGTSCVAIGGNHSCICISKMETLHLANRTSWSDCSEKCGKLACGSPDGVFMSVYSKVADYPNVSPPDTNPSCLTYDRNMSLESRGCNEETNIGGFICPIIDESQCRVNSGEEKWFDVIKQSGDKCMKSDVDCNTTPGQDGTLFWSSLTGVWIVRTNQTHAIDERPKYVSYVDENGKLKTTTKLDEEYVALCISATESLVSTTTKFSMLATSFGGSKEITTTHSNVSNPFISNQRTGENMTGVYVGVGIGCAVIATLIGLAVVLRKQVYRLMARKPKYGETFDNATESHTSGDVAPITASVSPELPNYFVLEPVLQEPINKQLHQTSATDADDESFYDMCGENRSTNRQQPSNVYNVAEHPDKHLYQSFYDHTNITRGNRAIKNGNTDGNYDSLPGVCDDNTYDVHDARRMIQDRKNWSENIYDTTGNGMSDGCIYDHTVDTKAHGATDENMYGHISFDVTDKDIEDTYNHI